MTARELGFLLLSSHLGDPDRKPLTVAQLRTLGERARSMPKPAEDRDLEEKDFLALGYGPEFALRILGLLEDEELLAHYLGRGRNLGCKPISRAGEAYPESLRQRLGLEAPGCLWAKGDVSILHAPRIALVGSRDISLKNEAFAAEVGRQAALQGYTLVSGNARGADRTAQSACLKAGGCVISVVADSLAKKSPQSGILYLSEDDYDTEFSTQRALSRNRIIHALAEKTFVAQSNVGFGGTWDGTVKNLRCGWSPVWCFDDGSEAMTQLGQMGANLTGLDELEDFDTLSAKEISFF